MIIIVYPVYEFIIFLRWFLIDELCFILRSWNFFCFRSLIIWNFWLCHRNSFSLQLFFDFLLVLILKQNFFSWIYLSRILFDQFRTVFLMILFFQFNLSLTVQSHIHFLSLRHETAIWHFTISILNQCVSCGIPQRRWWFIFSFWSFFFIFILTLINLLSFLDRFIDRLIFF